MPRLVLSREETLPRVAGVFRHYGYEGASLSRMRDATGLKSSSLYNYFPAGKQDMGAAVLGWAGALFEEQALAPLQGKGRPADRLAALGEALSAYYESGGVSCLLNLFGVGEAAGLFGDQLAQGVRRLLFALAGLAEESGAPPAEAAERAENALVAIEGALVVCRALGDTAPFQRVIARLPKLLLDPPALNTP